MMEWLHKITYTRKLLILGLFINEDDKDDHFIV